MRILFVDDDVEVTEYVRRGLEEEGHVVSVCHDGAAGLRAAELRAFDVIVLDVMMPLLNGFEVTRRLRRQHIRTPILLLTARDAPEDIVRGLEFGADDYLTKPFSFDVLLARIRVRTRTRGDSGQRMRFADLTLDTGTREVTRGTRQIALTRTEFAILECLMRASGRVVPRDTSDRGGLGRARSDLQQPRSVHPLPSREARRRGTREPDSHRTRARLPPEEF